MLMQCSAMFYKDLLWYGTVWHGMYIIYIYIPHVLCWYSCYDTTVQIYNIISHSIYNIYNIIHPPCIQACHGPVLRSEVLRCHLELRRDELKVDEAPGDDFCGFVFSRGYPTCRKWLFYGILWDYSGIKWDTLWQTHSLPLKMAIEIVDLPIKKCDFPQLC